MTYWISQLIHKPVERFRNPKLVDQTLEPSKLKNLKSAYFTIGRCTPLSILHQKTTVTNVSAFNKQTPIEYDHSMVDKRTFQKNEEILVREKLFNRHSYKLIHISDISRIQETVVSLSLMRNYNEGRHGQWNNYCCLRK